MAIRLLSSLSLSLISFLSLLGGPAWSEEQNHGPDADVAALGDFTTGVATDILKALTREVQEGGLSHAADFCSEHIGEIAPAAVKSHHDRLKASLPEYSLVSFRRITDRPRNPLNLASETDRALLKDLESLYRAESKMSGGSQPSSLARITGDRLVYLQAISVGPLCVSCHGNSEQIAPDLTKLLERRYPRDAAVGYSIGDFRGAFRVELQRISTPTAGN